MPRTAPNVERKAKAVAFVDAIMADLELSSTPELHGIMKEVPDPYSAATRNVIIRTADFNFWNRLLDALKESGGQKRVTAVGTPGVGKSTTASFAIRSILKEQNTVVYLQRTMDQSGYYIQISPSKRQEGHFDIQLIPEKTSPTDIPSLSDPESYYVVDPGKTKTTCDPSHLVFSHVIIVSSPDERHWGGSAFTKIDQSSLGGFILFFPSWSLAQLEAASNQLSDSQFGQGEVAELFAVFGGVPRNVFFPRFKERMKRELKTKVGALTIQQLQELVSGHLNRHTGFGADQPKGGIIDLLASEDFLDVELKLASSSILQWVRTDLMMSIWTEMATYHTPITWQLLEDYVCCALQGDNAYMIRNCVGKSDATYNNFGNHRLGQCTGKSLTADCTASVITGTDFTLFYSSDRFHPLYDMIYKSGNIYYAFQVTVGKFHHAKQHQLNSLVQRLQIGNGGRELKLYYAVHEGVFDDFVTNPVAPTAIPGVSVFHLKLEQGLA